MDFEEAIKQAEKYAAECEGMGPGVWLDHLMSLSTMYSQYALAVRPSENRLLAEAHEVAGAALAFVTGPSEETLLNLTSLVRNYFAD